MSRSRGCVPRRWRHSGTAAPSFVPHVPAAPLLQPQAPALLTAQGGNRCRQRLPPSAAAAVSRHSFPGVAYLARFIPPSPAWVSGDSSWPWPGASCSSWPRSEQGLDRASSAIPASFSWSGVLRKFVCLQGAQQTSCFLRITPARGTE